MISENTSISAFTMKPTSTELLRAVERCDVERVKQCLLDRECDVNAKDGAGCTALMVTVKLCTFPQTSVCYAIILDELLKCEFVDVRA